MVLFDMMNETQLDKVNEYIDMQNTQNKKVKISV